MMLTRSRILPVGLAWLLGLPATGVAAGPLDKFYKLEEQLGTAQEAYAQAVEELAAKSEGKTSEKPAVDGRLIVLKKMDALMDKTLGETDGAPIAIGTFFWSWTLDLDLDKLYGRFEKIVKHFPDNPGVDDVLSSTVDAAFDLEAPDKWARGLDRLIKTTKRDKTKTGALIALGQLQLRWKKPNRARAAFKRLIALKPDEETVKLAKGYLFEIKHLQVGKKAPNFTTTTLDGKSVKLESFRGKAVLLNFWASW